ncbi:Calx-beta domain-containing protein [Metapseudomonas furukawaii]|uniref:Calx-beta domain-containing protein n=1 Tax=Metapseudomonas furukawaii TaxID=1149133 RepID=UPI0040462B2F
MAIPVIQVRRVVVGELNSDPTQFVVWLSEPSATPITVNWSLQAHTATAADFTTASGTLTFEAGVTELTVPFVINNDLLAEGVETLKLVLSTPSVNALIGDTETTATLIDNDTPTATPRVSIRDFVVDEENREAWFVVTLDRAGTNVVTMNYATQNGTALAGSDYVAQSGSLAFDIGETAKTVRVSLINDNLAELSERFNLVLSNLTGGATSLDATGTATLHENDATPVATSTITVDDLVVGESETYADFQVRLNAPNLEAVSVRYQTLNETARNIDGDFVGDAGTLTFAAGETFKTVRVTLGSATPETTVDRTENFKLQLFSPSINATIARDVATATLIDNDAPTTTPRVSISDFVVDEESREAWFVVTLDRAGTNVVTMNYATQNGTALAGSDYVAQSGSLAFDIGETAKTVRVSLINDNLAELSERFNLVLSNLTGGATTLDATGTATLHENDATPVATSTITVDDLVVGESETYAEFQVRLNAPNLNAVSVRYQTLNESARNIDGDFFGDAGTLNFAAGEMVKTVRITLGTLGLETAVDRIENFKLQLFSPSVNATLARDVATATLIDNDNPTTTPRVSISDFVVDEENREAWFVVTLDRAGTNVVTMNYATQNGTALAGSDYVAQSGSLAFDIGETAKTVRVSLINDNLAELSERFNLVLSNLTGGATTLDATGTATLHENDATPVATSTITVDDLVVGESETYAEFQVRLNAPNLNAVSVRYQTLNESARNIDGDFFGDSGTLNFAAGEMVKTVRITLGTLGLETAVDRIENFKLQLFSPSVNATLARDVATATLIDNDSPTTTPRVSISDFVVDEESREAWFVVTLDRAGTSAVTMNYATQNGTALAGSDYVAQSGSLAFAIGETAKTVRVGLLNDALAESSESFNLVVSGLTGGAIAPDALGTAIIHENDATALATTTITVDDLVVGESDTYAEFQVRLNAPNQNAVSVRYQTINETARNIDGDFFGDSGTLNFAAGETVKTVRISLGTLGLEAGVDLVEHFKLQLFSPSANATIARPVGTATLVDNDAPLVTPSLSIDDLVIDEAYSLAPLTVRLDRPGLSPVTVNYGIQGTTAASGVDFRQLSSGMISFAPGETVKTIWITALNDALVEGPELLDVTLSAAVGATLADANAHVVIADSNGPAPGSPTITVSNAVALEGSGYLDFLVALDGPATSDVSVNYSTANGTALAGFAADYTGTSDTLRFAPGEMVKTVRVALNDDLAAEVVETFSLRLSAAVNAVIGTATATGSILDSESALPPVFALAGTAGPDVLRGTPVADTLTGGNGDDVLIGAAGADVMDGGAGNDTYVIDSAADSVTEAAAAGVDRILSAITYTLGANFENLFLTGSAAINGTGNALANQITGNAANNVLNGAGGADRMVGGLGNDTYVVDNAGDLVVEAASAGTDTVRSSITHVLAANVENLILTGAAAINGTGNALANVITGNGANNILNGGAGIDRLVGGLGNDTYGVDNAADMVVEAAGGGIDTVQASFSYVLGAEVENLTLTGVAVIDGTGNALDNQITGNAASNILDGGLGNDQLVGGLGADRMVGGLGNDTYEVGEVGDLVVETAGGGIDTVQSAITYVLGAEVENLTLTGAAAINGTGNTLANLITGNAANNALNGAAGADRMVGGLGNDTYVVDNAGDLVVEAASAGTDTVRSSITHVLAANVENLILTGAAAINGTGNTLANVITGNAGNNTLNGAAGADRMVGGLGNDTYVVDSAGDVVVEAVGGGVDSVQSSLTYVLGVELENLTLTGAAAINGTGNALANVITGNAGNNTLNGAAGADRMVGGLGNDTYVVDNAGDVVVEASGGGVDSVQSSLTYVLGVELENLTLVGAAAINGTGNTLANVITGNGANNLLNGAAGADRMVGGLGNDTYVVDNAGDLVVEAAGGGVDGVQSVVTHVLSAEVENLTLTGAAAINGTGNVLANILTGNGANNILNGAAGADRLVGGLGNDTYVVDNAGDLVVEAASAGTDSVQSSITHVLATNVENLTLTGAAAINGTGNALANVITGNAGNNALNGAAGADRLVGGLGDDTYVVDNTGDVVVEAGTAGTDRVLSSISHVLAANVENLTLTGGVAINGTGNGLANILTGNGANNLLNGAAGADRMVGGLGNDTYVVDNAGDLVVEAAGGGVDSVQSAVTHVLGAEVENLTLTGAAAISGTGNALANVITGNGANNLLNGAAGADRLVGGLGNDTYVVDNAGDLVVEAASAGADTVQSTITHVLAANVENLTLTGAAAINGTGNALDNVINGNGAANTLVGGLGNDVLSGAAGNDSLGGGAGSDTFRFSSAINQTTNVDTLLDFTTGVDTIALSRTIFSGISDSSLASGGFFRLGGAALDADDRILYDRSTGFLAYDADGTGVANALRIAVVGASVHPAVVATDFILV